MNSKLFIGKAISWLAGTVVSVIGLINMFCGNDFFFGLFLLILSFLYFPPVNSIILRKTRYKIPLLVKILLFILIFWAALGVGELFDKIDMMMRH